MAARFKTRHGFPGIALASLVCMLAVLPASAQTPLADRPAYLVGLLDPGPLKDRLSACLGNPLRPSDFSIGHRGAPLGFPEHTEESYRAGAAQGAGILECDVTFTGDGVAVCRHAQCDLHTTTDILARPSLAAKCATPAAPDQPGAARCCASDLTLAEFRSLRGRHDIVDEDAGSLEAFYAPAPPDTGRLMTHSESVALFQSLGRKFTPELKSFEGGAMSRAEQADAVIDAYRTAGVPPADVYPQSFHLDDVRHWIAEHPEFGRQAVLLDSRVGRNGVTPDRPDLLKPDFAALKAEGVNYIAPPLWVLLSLNAEGKIVPSAYARAARAAGLEIITWTLERSGTLDDGGGWYYQTVADAIDDDGDMLVALDVLARDVGVSGVFSDWPETTTFYANCMGIE